jgi:CheY-like chemotaxis protein
VVDDNQDSAKSLALLLKVRGNLTRTAHDGLQALQAAQEYAPDVVLLDIGLPGMNGYDVCRAIREQAWGKNIIMIAVTGWGQPEDRAKSKEAGFNAHLVKPVMYEALATVLSTVHTPECRESPTETR